MVTHSLTHMTAFWPLGNLLASIDGCSILSSCDLNLGRFFPVWSFLPVSGKNTPRNECICLMTIAFALQLQWHLRYDCGIDIVTSPKNVKLAQSSSCLNLWLAWCNMEIPGSITVISWVISWAVLVPVLNVRNRIILNNRNLNFF